MQFFHLQCDSLRLQNAKERWNGSCKGNSKHKSKSKKIIFASAYVKDTLQDAVKELKQAVELMQKPFKVQALVDTIEVIEPIKNYDIDAVTLKK